MDRTAVRGKNALTAEEAGLARAAAAGDGSAFAALYERYEQRAFNLAYRISGSEADAADAVQEAFLGAMRRLPRLAEGELAFGPYLFSATRNACHELTGRRPSEAIPESGEEVREANMRLPQRQREVLALRDLEELSYDEIAAIMEVDDHTVAQLISRARINLRDEMRGTALASVAAPSPECERALPLIATRDDGQLEADSPDTAWLDDHLAACHRCRLAVEAMQEADASYRTWAPIAAVPWLLKETMAKAAEAAGADWDEVIADAWAARGPTESLPGTPSAYREGSRRSKRPRRRLALATGLGALLLLAGVAAALVGSDPRATPADSTTGTISGKSARTPKPGKDAKAGKTNESHATRTGTTAAAQTTGGEAVPATVFTPPPASSGGPGASEPASKPHRPSGKTAVQPTQQTSASKPSSKPKPAPTSTTTSQTAPAPAPPTEEPPPAEESPSERAHEHEPPGKAVGRPPR